MAPPAAAHVVVFGELSPKSKVHYTRFLLDHDVKVSPALCCLVLSAH